MSGDYLFVVDSTPIEKNLTDYFASFAIKIMQLKSLSDIPSDCGILYALIIHWSLVKNNPEEIGRLFSHYPVPLLIINEANGMDACIRALESGADDFLLKPLNPRQLHARISAIKRRVIGEQVHSNEGKSVLQFTHWKLHLASRQLFDNRNQEVILSSGEYDLLLAFAQRPQQVLDREFLLYHTKHDDDLSPLDRRIDVQISRLRQKIEKDSKKPELIQTVRNNGYIFTAQVIRSN